MADGPDEGASPGAGRDDGDRPEPDPRHRSHPTDPESAEVDEAWAQIVSELDDVPGPGGREDEIVEPDAAGPPDRDHDEVTRPDPIDADPRGWVAEDDDDFEPPDPGPVLGGDPLLTMAWVGAVAPPLLLMVIAVLWQNVPPLVLQVAGAVFLAGVGVLIWRMPARRDHDDGPGAVV